jgi:small conductance mechanosensitive channel
MLQALLAVVLFFGPVSHASAPPKSAPSTQPAVATDVFASTPPEGISTADEETLGRILGKTRVGQLFEGKQKVTLDDVKNPLFWVDTLKDLIIAILGFIPRIIVAGLFLGFFWLIYRGVRRLVLGSLGTAGVDQSIRDMLGSLIKWAIMGFGLVIACNQIGVQIAALLTGVSIIGLAVGFAAKETIENFIAGIVIFWDKPFKVGDWVEVEGVFGEVKRVTFRSTRILDGSGQYYVFPNTAMLSKKLSNYSTCPATKVKIDISIAYKESVERARQVLLALLEADDRVSQDPEPSVGVTKCGGGSVDLTFSFWVPEESISRSIGGEYLEKAKIALDQAGIVTPSTAPAAPPPPPTTINPTIVVRADDVAGVIDRRELKKAG